ncbi:NAD-dependent epimerase/dehydratase family protein [Geodermatophilus sp. URMC 63]
MHCVVTGAAGFIGSHLTARLLREGHRVTGIDCFTDYYSPILKLQRRDELTSVAGDLEFINLDLTAAPVSEILRDVDVIFHQAGQPGVRASWSSGFNAYTMNNIIATQRLLEAAAGVPSPPKFVYASSSSVYGTATSFPTLETALPSPVSPYGVTKLAAEHLCVLYAKAHGVHTVSLRYFTVYGPGQRPDMAFTRFCRAADTRETVRIFGDGEQVRDFTYIDDVVDANLLSATHPNVPAGAVINIAGGTNASVNSILRIFGEELGAPVKAEYVAASRGDAARTGGDTTRAQQILGWQPRTDLRDGLRQQLDWVRSLTSRDLLDNDR